MALRLRHPAVADAGELGDVHVAAWQAAYRGVLPDDYLDGLRSQDRAAWWTGVLARAPREREVQRVAEVDGRVRGFVIAGPVNDDASEQGEIYVLNVHPGAWGAGIGAALLHAAESELRHEGFASAVLWVIPDNTRARRFYERGGWQKEGASRTEQVHGAGIEEVRYAKTLL